MAFPSVISRTPGVSSTTNSTSYSPALPASVAIGDLLVAVVSSDGNPTLSTTSTGWSKLSQASNSTVVTGAIFYKWYTDTTVGSLSVSAGAASEQYSSVVLRISGADNAALIGNSANGSSTNSDPPALTLTAGTQDYLLIATRSGDAQVVATVAPSTLNGSAQSWVQLQSQAGGGTNGASTNTAETTKNTGTNPDPGPFTSNTEQWVAYTLAIWGTSKTASPAEAPSTVTGYAPTTAVENPNPTFSPASVGLTVTGYLPTLVTNVIIAAAAGSAAFTGTTPWTTQEAATNYGGGYGGLLLALGQNLQPYVTPGAGSSSFTGYAPELGLSYTIVPETGVVTLSGQTPVATVTENGVLMLPDAGSLAFAGQQPSVYAGQGIVVPSGLAQFGADPPWTYQQAANDYGGGYGGLLLSLGNNLTGVRITTDSGALAFTGYAPDALIFGVISVPVGSLSFTGYAPTVVRGEGCRAYGPLLSLGLNLDPQTAGGYYTLPQVGSLTFTGNAPVLTRAGDYNLGWDELVAQPATFDGSGVKNVNIIQPILYPPSGSMAVTGYAPTVLDSVLITAYNGVVVVLGKAPSLGVAISVSEGAISLSGQTPTVDNSFPPISVPAGSLTATGYAPVLTKQGFGSGYLQALRAYIFKYDDYFGTGVLSALPASITSNVNRGTTGTGTLVAQPAQIRERGWALQPTDSEDWTCQDNASDTWSAESTLDETWTNV